MIINNPSTPGCWKTALFGMIDHIIVMITMDKSKWLIWKKLQLP